MSEPQDIRLDTRQGGVAGLAWRHGGAPQVLALHGWLDNAASFVPLAPMLGGLDLVAIDLPGHGHSEHRHASTRYHFIDYLFNVDATLDALGWDDCHLLGHSMGAAVSATYAAGAPERVRSITLLDTLGPISGAADGTAKRLRRSLFKNRRGAGRVRQFDSIDAMVKARRSVSGMSEPAARLICERAAKKSDSGYEWRSDPMLNWISALIMTDEQALDLLQHIKAPTLSMIVSEDSPWASRAKFESRRRAIAHGRHIKLEGHHHFHMDDPGRIADTIRDFIIDNDHAPAGDPNDNNA